MQHFQGTYLKQTPAPQLFDPLKPSPLHKIVPETEEYSKVRNTTSSRGEEIEQSSSVLDWNWLAMHEAHAGSDINLFLTIFLRTSFHFKLVPALLLLSKTASENFSTQVYKCVSLNCHGNLSEYSGPSAMA